MARKMSEDFIGTCQWCFGEYKVNGHRHVVLHGYTRPGHGYTIGNCPGYGHEPFDYAHDLTEQRIANLKAGIKSNQNQIKLIDAGKIKKIRNPDFLPEGDPKWDRVPFYNKADRAVEFYTPEEHEDNFNYYLRAMKGRLEAEIRFDEGVVEYLSAAVKNWVRKPIVGLDSPATGRERYVRDAYDPDKAAQAEETAKAKAARAAKPGKITLTVYTTTPAWPEWGGEHDHEKNSARRAAVDAHYAREKELKTNLKAWTKATFPADKYWVGDVYSGDVERHRRDLRGQNVVAAATKIDWKYLDQVLSMFPEGALVARRDNSPKDVRLFVDLKALGANI